MRRRTQERGGRVPESGSSASDRQIGVGLELVYRPALLPSRTTRELLGGLRAYQSRPRTIGLVSNERGGEREGLTSVKYPTAY